MSGSVTLKKMRPARAPRDFPPLRNIHRPTRRECRAGRADGKSGRVRIAYARIKIACVPPSARPNAGHDDSLKALSSATATALPGKASASMMPNSMGNAAQRLAVFQRGGDCRLRGSCTISAVTAP